MTGNLFKYLLECTLSVFDLDSPAFTHDDVCLHFDFNTADLNI